MRSTLLGLGTTCLLLSGTATAEDFDSHDAHVHGIAELMVAAVGSVVEVEFHSPAANIVGFEHSATTDPQKAAVARAQAILAKGENVLSFGDAKCETTGRDINMAGVLPEEHDEHHDEHEHGKGHKEAHRGEHDHGQHKKHVDKKHADKKHTDAAHADKHQEDHDDHNHGEADKGGGHSEVVATYQFNCDRNVSTVSVQLFTHFPAITTLNTAWVTNTQQGGAKLDKNATSFELKQ